MTLVLKGVYFVDVWFSIGKDNENFRSYFRFACYEQIYFGNHFITKRNFVPRLPSRIKQILRKTEEYPNESIRYRRTVDLSEGSWFGLQNPAKI